MSAAVLREAARLMRERAEKAVFVYAEHHPKAGQQVPWFDACDANSFDESDGPHITGMSPAVALAVADWLDLSANYIGTHIEGDWTGRALAVARAYLGDQP